MRRLALFAVARVAVLVAAGAGAGLAVTGVLRLRAALPPIPSRGGADVPATGLSSSA